ncbi:MAG TPA: triose-phosphate isomerase [Bacteroidia bacterium]|nr:triose-phosphate isomerase [Bacteroidia bacterium]HNG84167.1 triose-phosphate isomerase [Bacteroidia bacterium]
MRRKIVAGNWKMNGTLDDAIKLTSEIAGMCKDEINSDVQVVLSPPFPFLNSVSKLTNNTAIKVAAQNCAAQASGAFTGEVSASMITSCGAGYVILGHSERRTYFSDTDEVLLLKVRQALLNGLQVIFCIGETKAERESNSHFDCVEKQILNVLSQLTPDEFAKCIVAYEPVWAIGTGLTASPAQVQEMHHFIREVLKKQFGEQASETSILYGGSCNENNAKELFALPDVDGGLIGGASLKSRSFISIIKSF